MPKLYPIAAALVLFLCLHFIPAGTAAQVYATSQNNGVTGLCLLCSVTDAGKAVDSNPDTYASFNITAGLLGTTVYQTLIFSAAAGGACDSLLVGIGSSNSILSVNLFASITVQTFNGTTANNDAHILDSTNTRLTGNNTRAQIILKPDSPFDRVKITLNSSLLGLLTSFRIYNAFYKPALPAPVLPDSTTVCAGSSATLTATAIPGAVVSWYDAPAGGHLLATGYQFNVTPAVTTSYYAVATLNGCSSPPKQARVVVLPRPANPVYTVPQGRVCGSRNLLVTNYRPGIHYQVTVSYTGSGNLHIDTTYLVRSSAVVPVKDLAYYFNANTVVAIQAVDSLTGCRSDTVSMAFIFGGHAAPVKVTGDSATICRGDSVTLNANLFNDPNGINLALIRWYDAPTGGTLLYTGHNFRVKPMVTTTYYVTAAFECDYPVRTAARVTVRKLPDPVYKVPQGVVCGIQQLPVFNHQAGFNYRVRMVYRSFLGNLFDTSYVVVNSNVITTAPFYPVVPADADVFVQATDPGSGCTSDTIHMIYSLGGAAAMPRVDTGQVTICRGDSVTLHVFVPGLADATIRYKWYNAPAGGQLLYSGNFFRVSPGVTTTYYAASGYECEYPVRAPVVVTVQDCGSRLSLPVHSNVQLQQLQLYPNPGAGMIRILADRDLAGSLLVIYDLRGREVQREVLSSNGFQMVKQLPAGIYQVQVTTLQKRQVYSGRWVYAP